MKKSIVSTIIILVLLALTASLAYALWEDTKSTQVTATILPLPGGTFQIVFTSCNDAVFGYSSSCDVEIENQSSTIMSVGTITITTGHPYITIQNVFGSGNTVEPGQKSFVTWNYYHSSADPAVEGGPVTFDVEITCTGD